MKTDVLNEDHIKKAIEKLRDMKAHERTGIAYLIYNRFEWLHNPFITFTEEELDNADKKTGFIARCYGIDCYLNRFIN